MKVLEIKKWKKHPWNVGNQTEEVSVHFLNKIRNKKATTETDDLDGFIKDQVTIFNNIEKEGMRDPLLIVISLKHKTIRLESGNHRIQVAIDKGYTHLPVATLIIQEHYLNEGNGKHYYDAKNIINFEKLMPNPYPYQMKLSDILLKTHSEIIL